jgi:lipopolysaccharide transport system permease protein
MSIEHTKPAQLPIEEERPRIVSVIVPSKGWVDLKLGELWAYRELLYFLIWRDVKVRYKQTILGAGWAIIQPFTTMIVFTFLFGYLIAGVPSDGLPYPVFSLAALVPWQFFESGFQKASESMVGSANIIKKVYFPRFAVPASCVLSGLIDFAIGFVMLVGVMLFYSFGVGLEVSFAPTVHVLALPYFILLMVVTTLGASLWFAAMNVQFRDVRYIVPFLVRTLMYVSPVITSSSVLYNVIPEAHRHLIVLNGLNPIAGIVEGFRWSLLHNVRGAFVEPGQVPPLTDMQIFHMSAISGIVATVMLISGAFYFKRMERTFADVV